MTEFDKVLGGHVKVVESPVAVVVLNVQAALKVAPAPAIASIRSLVLCHCQFNNNVLPLESRKGVSAYGVIPPPIV